MPYVKIANLKGEAGPKGEKGDTGTFVSASAVTVAAGEPARVEILGPEGAKHAKFSVPRGLPGVNAVPSDEFIASVVGAPDSETRIALETQLTDTGTRPVGKGELSVNAADYRNGNGDAEALRAAGLAATAKKSKVLIDGTWTPTGNIAGFWNAAPTGAGTITREGVTFHVGPRPVFASVGVNTIYVDGQAGSDGNDGLSPSYPFQSLNGVYRHVLRRLTPEQAAGAKWVIHCRGTLAPPPQLAELPDFPLGLEFDGGPLAGGATTTLGGVPQTKIVRGHGGSSLIMGLWFEPGIQKVIVKRIQFEGFAVGFNGYGLIMKGGGYLEVEDCIAVGCDCGFSVVNNVTAYMRRVIARDGGTGFRGHYMSVFTWTDCKALNNSGQGFGVSRGSVGHADYCTAEGNVNGLVVNMQGRVAVVGGRYAKNSNYGIRAEGNTEWSNHKDYPVDYGVGTSDANGIAPFVHFGNSNEVLIAQRSISSAHTHVNNTISDETGFTGKKTVRVVGAEGVLENHLMGPTKRMRMRVQGTFLASSAARDIIIRLATFAGSNISDGTIVSHPAGPLDVNFVLEAEFNQLSATQISGYWKMTRSGEADRVGYVTLNYPTHLDISPRVVLDHADAATSTRIRGVDIWVEG